MFCFNNLQVLYFNYLPLIFTLKDSISRFGIELFLLPSLAITPYVTKVFSVLFTALKIIHFSINSNENMLN